jgi:DNA-binding transcriptional regulator YiaG
VGKVANQQFLQLSLSISKKNDHLQKLTSEQVFQIRQSTTKQSVLARKYDVSEATISRIKNRKAYNNYL